MNLQLFIDVTNKRLLAGATNNAPFVLPPFIRQDAVNLVVALLAVNPTGGLANRYLPVDLTGLSLRAGIGFNSGAQAGEVIALQTTWTPDLAAMTFSGTLSLNTVAVDKLLDQSVDGTVASLFEIVVLENGNESTVVQTPCIINGDVIRADSLAPEAMQNISAVAGAMAQVLTNNPPLNWVQNGNQITAAMLLDPNGGLQTSATGLAVKFGSTSGAVADGAAALQPGEGRVICSATAPNVLTTPAYANYLWIDTSVNPRVLNGWNSTTAAWQAI